MSQVTTIDCESLTPSGVYKEAFFPWMLLADRRISHPNSGFASKNKLPLNFTIEQPTSGISIPPLNLVLFLGTMAKRSLSPTSACGPDKPAKLPHLAPTAGPANTAKHPGPAVTSHHTSPSRSSSTSHAYHTSNTRAHHAQILALTIPPDTRPKPVLLTPKTERQIVAWSKEQIPLWPNGERNWEYWMLKRRVKPEDRGKWSKGDWARWRQLMGMFEEEHRKAWLTFHALENSED